MTDRKFLGEAPESPLNPELWDYPEPYVVTHRVTTADTDALGHSNNVCYLAWLERCAWEHSAAVGFDIEQMLAINRAMVVRDVRMQYLQATFVADELYIGDWIAACDGRLRATRRFQIIRAGDGVSVMRADIDYVCIDVRRGRPARMPAEFVAAYPVLASTAEQM